MTAAGTGGWESAVVRVYVDGETTASIEITLLELANIGKWKSNSKKTTPWGVGLFGHTAKNGVYSTVRIPFGETLRTTLTSSRSGSFSFTILGVENYPVLVGDITLPTEARLKVYHKNDILLKPYESLAMVDVDRGTAGAVFILQWDAISTSLYFMEACVRAYFDGSDTPIFLASGGEDYFLSAWYFNEGEFETPEAGVTFFNDKTTVSAYKVHDRDPIIFDDGFRMEFRNCEKVGGCGNSTHCPD
eukprot:UN24323